MDKTDFVKNCLLPLLQAANRNITNATYENTCDARGPLEYVYVHYANNVTIPVYVTSDSLLRLIIQHIKSFYNNMLTCA